MYPINTVQKVKLF